MIAAEKKIETTHVRSTSPQPPGLKKMQTQHDEVLCWRQAAHACGPNPLTFPTHGLGRAGIYRLPTTTTARVRGTMSMAPPKKSSRTPLLGYYSQGAWYNVHGTSKEVISYMRSGSSLREMQSPRKRKRSRLRLQRRRGSVEGGGAECSRRERSQMRLQRRRGSVEGGRAECSLRERS